MNITIEQLDDHTATVTIAGEMDALACNDARPLFEQLAKNGANNQVQLNLEQVTFLDSSGIGAIVFLFKRLKATQGSLSICNVYGQPRELMQLLRIDKAISVDWGAKEQTQARVAS